MANRVHFFNSDGFSIKALHSWLSGQRSLILRLLSHSHLESEHLATIADSLPEVTRACGGRKPLVMSSSAVSHDQLSCLSAWTVMISTQPSRNLYGIGVVMEN